MNAKEFNERYKSGDEVLVRMKVGGKNPEMVDATRFIFLNFINRSTGVAVPYADIVDPETEKTYYAIQNDALRLKIADLSEELSQCRAAGRVTPCRH